MLVGSCPSALVRSFLQVRVLLNPSIRVPNGSVLYAYCCNVLFWNFMLGVGNVMQLHDSLLNSHWSTFSLYFGLAVFVGLLYDGILEVVFVVVLVHYNTLLVEDRMDVYSWILHGC